MKVSVKFTPISVDFLGRNSDNKVEFELDVKGGLVEVKLNGNYAKVKLEDMVEALEMFKKLKV